MHFNLQTALIADDYNYRFIFGTANQRVEHIFDIIESMRAHYHTMNGRLILHSLTQLFLLWGKPVFNVVNTVGYLLFTGLIYCTARARGGIARRYISACISWCGFLSRYMGRPCCG